MREFLVRACIRAALLFLLGVALFGDALAQSGSLSSTTSYIRDAQGSIVRIVKVAADGSRREYLPLLGHNGSVIGVIDESGNLVEEPKYDAFGVLSFPSPQQSHLYAGEYWDKDSELLYLRSRWYDPKIGRFISPDSFEGKSRDPRSLNRYGYAHGNPIANVDPSGKSISLTEIGVGMAVVGTLAIAANSNLPPGGAPGSSWHSGGTGSMDPCEAFGIGCKDDGLGSPGPGRAQSRINIQTGDKKKGWTHVVDGHFNPHKNKSQFTISQEEVKRLLGSRKVIDTPAIKQFTSDPTGGPASMRYVRVVDVGREVGLDKFAQNQPTQVMTVMTDGYGNLITCFPGTL